jgi:heat shock protein HtpX
MPKGATMNRTKTVILLATLTAVLVWAGDALGGQTGLLTALVFAGVMNFGAYWWSDRLILRMFNAQEVTEREAPALHRLVRELALRGGIPMPRVYLIPETAPNAFATGRNPQHAAVAVTDGLMQVLEREELEGVIAHELGHVKNRDTLVMTIAATIAGAVSMLAHLGHMAFLFGGSRSSDEREEGGSHPLAGLLGIIVAPIAAVLIQAAISRSREFLADEAGARLCGNPRALASALKRIEALSRARPMTAGSPATAHLFIVNPFSGGGVLRLFSTHPPIEQRVARLELLAREGLASLR